MSFLLKRHSLTAAPPPSFPPAASKDDEPAIPDPAVFRTSALLSSSLPLHAAPTVAQCAVHLELLQAFSKLNHRVTKESAFIEIFATVHEEPKVWWRAFVEVAVGRFGVWWRGVEEELRRREKVGSERGRAESERGAGGLSTGRSESVRGSVGGLSTRRSDSVRRSGSVRSGTSEGKRPGSVMSGVEGLKVRELPEDMLPPLDVLMVWHSYLLNPRCYNEDALHFGYTQVLSLAFPWSQIHSAIDIDTFDYTLPPDASKFFETLTHQSPNLIDDLLWKDASPTHTLHCPTCATSLHIRICDSERRTHSWIDPDFTTTCTKCSTTITKALLCAAKLHTDLSTFLDNPSARLRMTNLDPLGRTSDPTTPPWDAANFANTHIRTTALPPAPASLAAVETALLSAVPPDTPPAHVAALKAVLGAYSTPSAFSLGLTAAVIRQGDFVAKMNDQLWIRSPGLIGTLPLESLAAVQAKRAGERGCVVAETPDGFLARAVERYRGFFALFKAYPGRMLVPALDVDLVWHSGMLTAGMYRVWCGVEAGRFVDHDDKLGGEVLEGGFEFTGEVFQQRFGTAWVRCCCWFCGVARNEGLNVEGGGRWARWRGKWGGKGRKERAARIRVEFYREVERRRREKLGGLSRGGLFEALKRC